MRLQKLVHPLLTHVAFAVSLMVPGVYLRVRPSVAHALFRVQGSGFRIQGFGTTKKRDLTQGQKRPNTGRNETFTLLVPPAPFVFVHLDIADENPVLATLVGEVREGLGRVVLIISPVPCCCTLIVLLILILIV